MIGQEKNRRRADGQRQTGLSSIAHILTTVIDRHGGTKVHNSRV